MMLCGVSQTCLEWCPARAVLRAGSRPLIVSILEEIQAFLIGMSSRMVVGYETTMDTTLNAA